MSRISKLFVKKKLTHFKLPGHNLKFQQFPQNSPPAPTHVCQCKNVLVITEVKTCVSHAKAYIKNPLRQPHKTQHFKWLHKQ